MDSEVEMKSNDKIDPEILSAIAKAFLPKPSPKTTPLAFLLPPEDTPRPGVLECLQRLLSKPNPLAVLPLPRRSTEGGHAGELAKPSIRAT
jgi:hypothetical protein